MSNARERVAVAVARGRRRRRMMKTTTTRDDDKWMGGVGRRARDDDAGCVARSEGWLWIPMTIGGSRIAFVGVMRALDAPRGGHGRWAVGDGRGPGGWCPTTYDLRPMYSRPIRREDCRDSRDDGGGRAITVVALSPYRRPITVVGLSPCRRRRRRRRDAREVPTRRRDAPRD